MDCLLYTSINVPFEASLTEETMALSARLAGAEMIKMCIRDSSNERK